MKPLYAPLLNPYYLLCLSLFSLTAQSAEWSIEPSVSVREEYNDNIRLTTLPHKSVWGTSLTPAVNFSSKTEISEITGGARLNFYRYSGEPNLDSNDQIFSLLSKYKTERNTFGLNGSYVRDSTLASELISTGVVQARKQRGNLTLNPSWTTFASERTWFTLDYQLSRVKYDDAAAAGLNDYNNQTASVSAVHRLSEQDQLSGTIYYSKYETSPANFKSNTTGLRLGITHDFSETFNGSLTLGTRSTLSKSQQNALVCPAPVILCQFGLVSFQVVPFTTETRSDGYTLNASLNKQFETTTLSGQISREANPSANGALVQADRIGFSVANKFAPTLTGSVDASIYRSRYIGNIITSSNSRYYTVGPRLSWRMSEWWSLDTGYTHSRQEYDNASAAAATANSAYVLVRYDWPKLAVSR